jgi:hypothetical protein
MYSTQVIYKNILLSLGMKFQTVLICILGVVIVAMSFFVKTVSDKNALKIERLETEKELLRIQFEKSRDITDSLERNTAALKQAIQKSKITIAEQEKSLQALKKRSKTYQYVEKYTDTRLDSFFRARYPRTDVHFFDSASDRK